MYKQLIFPTLKQFDAEEVHERTLALLAWSQRNAFGRAMLRLMAGPLPQKPVTLWGLQFPNVMGMAAGFDKDVCVAEGLALLGFGHIEVGTLTPRPQVGNVRPRIFRLPEDRAIINRMGFPNGGVAAALPRLRHLAQQRRRYVLGVSLGKQKETPLAEAVLDYMMVMRQVYAYADYLVVNVSSPNTPGLRDLQGGDYLGHLLGQLQGENGVLAGQHGVRKRPLLVKIAPDLNEVALDEVITAVLKHHIDGVIATNTTISRAGVISALQVEPGGLSGPQLQARSNEMIHTIYEATNGQVPIIGVGGVHTAADVRAKLEAGASLVQLYTGLIYEGPQMIGRILRAL